MHRHALYLLSVPSVSSCSKLFLFSYAGDLWRILGRMIPAMAHGTAGHVCSVRELWQQLVGR